MKENNNIKTSNKISKNERKEWNNQQNGQINIKQVERINNKFAIYLFRLFLRLTAITLYLLYLNNVLFPIEEQENEYYSIKSTFYDTIKYYGNVDIKNADLDKIVKSKSSFFISAQTIDHSIWTKAKSTNNILRQVQLQEFYIENQDCQQVTSSCAISPSKPKPREGHTSIYFKTYNITDASRMCPPNYCGPYCREKRTPPGNNECFVNNSTGDDVTALEPNAQLEGLKTSNDTSFCPPNCCSTMNELCLREYDVSGRRVYLDQEVSCIKITLLTI